jgi:hypothetical protein
VPDTGLVADSTDDEIVAPTSDRRASSTLSASERMATPFSVALVARATALTHDGGGSNPFTLFSASSHIRQGVFALRLQGLSHHLLSPVFLSP